MLVGVISDTHLKRGRTVPEQVIQGFRGVDLILHAGDLVTEEVLEELSLLAPVEAVAGNNDSWELYHRLGSAKVLTIGGYLVGLTHGHLGKGSMTVQRALSNFTDVSCVVFGHSHIPYSQTHSGVLAFNPGSPTDRRGQPRFSYGLLHIDGAGIRGEHHFFGP